MFSKLFHKDVFMPGNAQEVANRYQKRFEGYYLSRHLQEHLENAKDRSHNYLEGALRKCLETLKEAPQEAFEIELSKDFNFFGKSGWVLTKYCVRIPYSDTEDIVVSIRPQYDKEKKEFDFSRNMVVTAWMNSKNDPHYTLDSSKYCSKKEWDNLRKF